MFGKHNTFRGDSTSNHVPATRQVRCPLEAGVQQAQQCCQLLGQHCNDNVTVAPVCPVAGSQECCTHGHCYMVSTDHTVQLVSTYLSNCYGLLCSIHAALVRVNQTPYTPPGRLSNFGWSGCRLQPYRATWDDRSSKRSSLPTPDRAVHVPASDTDPERRLSDDFVRSSATNPHDM